MNIKHSFVYLFMIAGTAHTGLSAHYGLVSKDQHLECQDKIESYNGTINTNIRAATGWFKGMFGNDQTEINALPADIQECLSPDLISQASIFWGTNVMDPIIDQGNEWFSKEDKSLTQRTTEGAKEALDGASEGVANRYERSKDWIADQWNSIRGSEEEVEENIVTPIPTPSLSEEALEAPRYNEAGDLVESEPSNWRERTKNAIDGIDWTPWN